MGEAVPEAIIFSNFEMIEFNLMVVSSSTEPATRLNYN